MNLVLVFPSVTEIVINSFRRERLSGQLWGSIINPNLAKTNMLPVSIYIQMTLKFDSEPLKSTGQSLLVASKTRPNQISQASSLFANKTHLKTYFNLLAFDPNWELSVGFQYFRRLLFNTFIFISFIAQHCGQPWLFRMRFVNKMDLIRLIRQTSSLNQDFTAILNQSVSGGVVCLAQARRRSFLLEKSVAHLKRLYAPEIEHLRGPGSTFCRKGKRWSFLFCFLFYMSHKSSADIVEAHFTFHLYLLQQKWGLDLSYL